jgi:hypothetical protein
MKKAFRVLISEQFGFYVDVEAENETQAMDTVRARLKDPNDDITPIEDNRAHEGYQVYDAHEINREDADLE